MAGVYANLFKVQASDIVRIVSQDERPTLVDLPTTVSLSADVVMTRANAKQLAELLTKLVSDGQ